MQGLVLVPICVNFMLGIPFVGARGSHLNPRFVNLWNVEMTKLRNGFESYDPEGHAGQRAAALSPERRAGPCLAVHPRAKPRVRAMAPPASQLSRPEVTCSGFPTCSRDSCFFMFRPGPKRSTPFFLRVLWAAEAHLL